MNDYQNDFANDLSSPTYDQKPRKGWFGRNWLWFVPLVILLPVLCCCGGPLALIWFGVGQVFELPPYKDTIAIVEQNTEVQNALGTPIESPESFMDLVTMMQGGGELNFNQVGSQMTFDANVPLTGPNGSATLYIQAESTDAINWTYTVQQVELPDGTVIDLIPGGSGTTTDPDAEEPADEGGDSGREIPDQA